MQQKKLLINVEEKKLAKITLGADENSHKRNSYTLCIILFSTTFSTNIGICTYFIYFHWYLDEDVIHVKLGTIIQTTI